MSDQTFTNYICWKKQKLRSIINIEALSIELPVFLATHVPFHTIHYLKSPQHVPKAHEGQLLNELLDRSKNDEHTFLIVQGMAGSGKSHLIRWLSERYKAESLDFQQGKEVVVLIQRANSSLRQTLLQITEESHLFDSPQFADQIAQIKRATSQLSDQALTETLLHWLRVGIDEQKDIEIVMDKVHRIRRRVDPYLSDFLLNPKVREHLKRNGGPIERLLKHLSDGKRATEVDLINEPVFKAEDFEFETPQLREIEIGVYEATRKLVRDIDRKPEAREYIAKYLNELISFAIQQTTQISVDDLKAMFMELRKELKKQGKSLVLMVEDISVFTGLDAGLIDVMVTQHTGDESQRRLCRMTSIVGVTDAYFKDSFPANIKQRIQHHVTLNASTKGQDNSTHLFNDVDEMSKFVSRYLNLLRMDPVEFKHWSEAGCLPIELPNACHGCLFQEKCHESFGKISLDDSSKDRDVGLYPFNENFLQVISTNLDTTKRSKTPRTLLELIEYMLGHSNAIENDQFPSGNPLPYLNAPRFDHFNYIKTKSGKYADRLERFMMYWGDRTINEKTYRGVQYIGGIPSGAFEAFGLPIIGKKNSDPKLPDESGKDDIDRPLPPPIVPIPTPSEINFRDEYYADIYNWRRGDSKLKTHAEIKRMWHSYLKSRIDWDYHHITHVQLEKFTAPRLVIEEQDGRATGNYLLFERNDELAEFFEALTQVNRYYDKLPPDKIGRYLFILDLWLERHEAQIVQFVKTPYQHSEDPDKLEIPPEQILFELNFFLAMLGGDLQSSQQTSSQILESIVRKLGEFNNVWNRTQELIKERGHSSEWIAAIKWGSRKASNHRVQFLQMLNRPQGTARKEARFIDAPYLLELINQLNRRDWILSNSKLPQTQTTSEVYQEWLKAYNHLQGIGDSILGAQNAFMNETVSELRLYMEGHSIQEVFDTIDTTLQALKGRAYGRFRRSEELTAKKLKNRLARLEEVLAKTGRKDKIFAYASIHNTIRDLWEYIDYFEQYNNLLERQLSLVETELNQEINLEESADPGAKVEASYQSLLNALNPIVSITENNQEVHYDKKVA